MINNTYKKVREDRGDSVISAIIVLPLIFFMIITSVDLSIMLANKATLESAADNAARTVAIVGGDGTTTKVTPLEKAYGGIVTPVTIKAKDGSDISVKDCTTKVFPGANESSSNIECQLAQSIYKSGLTAVKVLDKDPNGNPGINCTPSVTTHIGQNVTCSVAWQYQGLPGSAMSFIKIAGNLKAEGNASSEVKLSTSQMVAR